MQQLHPPLPHTIHAAPLRVYLETEERQLGFSWEAYLPNIIQGTLGGLHWHV